MRFITITLIVHAPDPRTGEQKSTQEWFREVPSVMHLHADAGGLTDAQHRASLELFQSDIAPVLRREIPDPPWGWGGGPLGDDALPARAVAVTG